MNLFDSATAEMKRMRNQKKDGTALQQMKRSSAEIEPTEWIFNADGEFCRARDIFDESAESSPVSDSRFTTSAWCSLVPSFGKPCGLPSYVIKGNAGQLTLNRLEAW